MTACYAALSLKSQPLFSYGCSTYHLHGDGNHGGGEQPEAFYQQFFNIFCMTSQAFDDEIFIVLIYHLVQNPFISDSLQNVAPWAKPDVDTAALAGCCVQTGIHWCL